MLTIIHLTFQSTGLRVESYGTGSQVRQVTNMLLLYWNFFCVSFSSSLWNVIGFLFLKTSRLPGISAMEPRTFKFGTSYVDMYNSLSVTADDTAFFQRNGVLQLCRRGAAVKRAPQRWQDETSEYIGQHDVTICFEERIFDAVVEDLQIREPTENFDPIHVICLDTKDNPHEAQKQGQVALDLCWRLEAAADDLIYRAAEIVEEFQEERMTHTPIKVLYQLCYL
jgi:RNA polymerase II subunit A C-terminal domain phosphatase SSU72